MVVISVATPRTGHRNDPDRLRRHRIDRLLRRLSSGDGASVALDPFDEEAMSAVLAWMEAGIEAGTDPSDLRAEIATRLWPWANRICDAATRRLPSHADAAEVRGRVATVLWQCCDQLDPARQAGWASWLRIRIRGAIADAGRADDRLSRRDRRSFTRGAASAAVVGAALPSVSLDAASDLPFAEPEPGQAVVDGALRGAVHRWMAEDLPPELAARLHRWWQTTGATTSLPAGLAEEIRPYVFLLAPAVALLD